MKTLPNVASLDDVRQILADLPGPDEDALFKARMREPQLTKPAGSLGRLEELSHWISAWQGRHPARIMISHCNVYVANHGVVAQGVSAYPSEVTSQMMQNFIKGGAAINQLCGTFDVALQAHELVLDVPTHDFSEKPAMADVECAQAIAYGLNTVPHNADLLILGEMGIGNTTSAAAMAHGLFGETADVWTGRGTGIDDETLVRKTQVVADSVALHQETMTDGLEVLRCVGGRELGAMAGAILAGRLLNIPVLLDGYVGCAAAAALYALRPDALNHCKVAHVSAEPGHKVLLDKINQRPLLDFDMRLGEGSGAALAVGLVKAAVNCHNNMATFAEAGVSSSDES